MGYSAALHSATQTCGIGQDITGTQVSIVQVMAPKYRRFGFEMVTAQFAQSAYGQWCEAPCNRLGDFMTFSMLSAKFKALSAGDGELSAARAMARYVTAPICALAQRMHFKTSNETLEPQWGACSLLMQDMTSNPADRTDAMIGLAWSNEMRADAASREGWYTLHVPWSWSRAPSVAFFVSGTLLSPCTIAVDTAQFEHLATSNQYNEVNEQKAYVTPKQAGSCAYPTLEMHLTNGFIQVTREERNMIIARNPEFLQTIVSRQQSNTITISGSGCCSDGGVHHRVPISDNSAVRCYFMTVQACNVHNYRAPDSFEPFNFGGAEDQQYILHNATLVLDGNPRNCVQSGRMLNLGAARMSNLLEPRLPYYLFAEGVINTTFGPGFFMNAAVDSIGFDLELNALPAGTQLASGEPYAVGVTTYIKQFELYRVEGAQIYRAYRPI